MNDARTVRFWALVAMVLAGTVAGCRRAKDVGVKGRITAALTVRGAPGVVSGVALTVVGSTDPCTGTVLASATAPLLASPDIASVKHIFELGPGTYKVCGAPVGPEGASAGAGAAETIATVVADSTAEVALGWMCVSTSGGAAQCTPSDAVPQITALDITAVAGIGGCQSVVVAIVAADPEGDALGYEWAVIDGPGQATIGGNGTSTASLVADTAGMYRVRITVGDQHGGSASLTFPVAIANAGCQPAPDAGTGDSDAGADTGTGGAGGADAAAEAGGPDVDSGDAGVVIDAGVVVDAGVAIDAGAVVDAGVVDGDDAAGSAVVADAASDSPADL